VHTSSDLVSPHDQRVTFVELFFDLVFVFCITQIVTLLHGHVDARSAGSALLVFWLVWWAWTQYAWALNAANTDHPRVQLTTLLATAVAFLLAVGIPRALSDDALWFAVPYVVVRVIGLLLYYWVAGTDPGQRRAVQVFGLFSIGGLLSVIVGAVLGGTVQYVCWALTIVLDLIAAGIGGRLEGWNLHPDHFVERHGLIVIIALGETLIVAASGLVEAPPTSVATVTAILAVLVASGMWWGYFRHARPAFEHAMASCDGSTRSTLARDVFSVLHFPMLCGIIAMAAATEQALAHPDAPLAGDFRAALGGGVVLFISGSAVAMWRATGRLPVWRMVLVPPVAAAVAALGKAPVAAMGMLLVLIAVVAALEHGRDSHNSSLASSDIAPG
jgi:low temperature requirement protein LtrA